MATANDPHRLAAQPCVINAALAGLPEIQQWRQQVPQWTVTDKELSRAFDFKNFLQTMAFVNAVAWVAHRENHHPDMLVSYQRCTLKLSTHSAGGLTKNDFITAAKIDRLFDDNG